MSNDSSNAGLPPDEQLVAYLDGELDLETRRRIEELLASNADVRRRLQEMERTWELLDELDAAPAGSLFTHTTLEMVALTARRELDQSFAEAPRRRWRHRLAMCGGTLAAVLAGFLTVALLAPDPNHELLQDLPVLENLDQYRQTDDIEFLRLLRAEGLFIKDAGETARYDIERIDAEKTEGLFTKDAGETPVAMTAHPDESSAQRRQRIDGMSPDEKERLLRLQERFDALDDSRQQQLRRLDEAIREAADAAELRQIMHRYCEWLRTLPSYARAELVEMKPADRMKSIKKHFQEETRGEGKRFSGKDAEVLMRWLREYATQHEAQFVETLSESRRKKLSDLSPPMRHRMVFWEMWQQWQSEGPGKPPFGMTDDDLARLRGELSPERRERLESLPTAEQWRRVAGWLRYAVRQNAAARSMHGQLSEADDERLAKFFETGLSDKERDRLLGMSGEEMQRELERLFLMRERPLDGPRHGRSTGSDRVPPKRLDKASQPPGTL
jgi:anti-sigma factor RsiW